MSFIGTLCLLLNIIFVRSNVYADVLVTLPEGTIRGRLLASPSNTSFRAFQGIPYATPPLGTLRFQEPQPPKNWSGILNTTKDGNICYSIKRTSADENEDCLFVNVFTPILNNANKTKIPVMVWIYGGSYRTGSSKYENFGPDYLIERNVIIVTFNYRLGPFGFLSTGDILIPGNAGLKDQHLALKWVNTNIHLFGGDNEKVTIFGQSAGGSSVGYQLLYKKNQGLFRAAILESGSPLSSFSFMNNKNPRDYAFDLAIQINGSINLKNDTNLLQNYLLSVTGKDIDDASTHTVVTDKPLPVIEPDYDGAFITKESFELLEVGDFIRVPIIIGTTSEEYISMATDLNTLQGTLDSYETNHKKFIPGDFNVKSDVNKSVVGDAIRNLYLQNVTSDEKLGHFIRYKSQSAYSIPMIKHADLASNYIDVYFYIFSHDGPMGNSNITVKGADGVGHSEDPKYLFKVTSSDYSNEDLSKFSTSDVLTHDRMITLWTNFAKTLNPTFEESIILQNLKWPKVKPGDFQYLDIGDELSIRKNPKNPYYKAWTQFYNDWAQRPFTTY